jgi:type I restriction enzyme S subunit
VKPFWTLYRREKSTGHPDEELLSVYRDYGVIPKSSRDDNGNVESEDLNAYQLVDVDDLVMNKMKAWQGSVAVSDIRGIVSPAYFVFKPLHEAHGPFLHHLLRSKKYIGEYNRLSKGIRVGQWDLEPIAFRTTPVVLPPYEEQVAIAEFLDRETAQIDGLIEKQEQLIEKLTERRLAVIDNLVTTGLVKNVEMVPSGVAWFGDIPKHWRMESLRYQVSRVKRPINQEKIITAFRDGQVTLRSNRRLEGFTEATDYSGYQGIEPGDLVIHAMDAFAGCIGVSDSKGMGSPVLSVARVHQSNNPLFLAFALRVMARRGWIEALSRSIRERTSEFRWADASAQKIPIPPREEQDEIVHKLNEAISRIDVLREQSKLMIGLLQERRQALISATVTGKIDVRGN